MTEQAIRSAFGPSRFGPSSTALEVVAGHDLGGRDVIVTGGAGGIGSEAVRAFATAGARVLILDRSIEPAQSLAEHLRSSTGNRDIGAAVVDLSSVRSVGRFVAGHLAESPKLDILVNNAGLLQPQLVRTEDGFESHLGTHFLGHFALAIGLLPALKRAGNARIVSVSSLGHRLSDVHFDDINYEHRPYEVFEAYGQSKTAVALFAVAFTKRHGADGITANALHPGAIRTGLHDSLAQALQMEKGWIDKDGATNAHYPFRSAGQGAATIVWAAVTPALEGVGAQFLADCAVTMPWSGPGPLTAGHHMAYAVDPANAELLWQVGEEAMARASL
jgi:NAD(P)-dependent dehydrogenase (short-subunit alcohol dehydrogenase family)